jgi:hypothetical protein
LNELFKRVGIFRHKARILEVFIIDNAGEENCSQLMEALGHCRSPLIDVIQAQGRTRDDENEAEK